MKKISLLFVCILILLSVALAACGPAEPEVIKETVEIEVPVEVPVEVLVTAPPEPEGPITISFWHIYSEEEMNMLEDTLIPQFEANYDNVTVESVQIPYNEFRRKLLTAIAGGTAPDLIRSDIIWVPEFAHMGALVALDEFMPDFDDYATAVFQGPLETNFYNGHYYGLPLDTNNRVLITNTAMFEAAGVEAAPTTIDEFLVACEQIATLGEGKYCFADGGTYAWAANPWIWSFGGDVTDPAYTVASGYLNSAATQEAYEFLKMLVDEGYMHPGILGGGVDTWGGFGNDEIAMILEGPWFPTIFGTDKDYGFSLMPAGAGGAASVIGGEDIVMFQQSQHKEIAADFIRFMLSTDSQVAMASVGQMPVLVELTDPSAPIDHDFYGIFLEQAETAEARTPHPNFTKLEGVYQNAGLAFLRGEMSFEEAFDAAAAEIDALLILEE